MISEESIDGNFGRN